MNINNEPKTLEQLLAYFESREKENRRRAAKAPSDLAYGPYEAKADAYFNAVMKTKFLIAYLRDQGSTSVTKLIRLCQVEGCDEFADYELWWNLGSSAVIQKKMVCNWHKDEELKRRKERGLR
jgi:hypothetical protein